MNAIIENNLNNHGIAHAWNEPDAVEQAMLYAKKYNKAVNYRDVSTDKNNITWELKVSEFQD